MMLELARRFQPHQTFRAATIVDRVDQSRDDTDTLQG